MANARQIVQRLVEGIDDPEDLDSPESFDVAGHIDSPVARLAATNGFTRDDRTSSEERWVKRLSNGQEAWLRTSSNREWEHPMDMQDPSRHGGREWELLLVKPQFKCDHCNQDRPAKKGTCPHCKQSSKIVRWNDHEQIARANEVVMSYLLGAILQRLATWPENLPKPGQPGWKKAFESLGVDDPDAFFQNLDKTPDHEMIDTSSPPPSNSRSYNCACGQWSFSGLANNPEEQAAFEQQAQSEYAKHTHFASMTFNNRPVISKLQARNWVTARRLRKENLGVDDPEDMLRHLKAQDGCPYCGCPDFDRGTSFVAPTGKAVYNQICHKCGRYYCKGEEKTRIVPN